MNRTKLCCLASISTSSAEAGQEGEHITPDVCTSNMEQVNCRPVSKAAYVRGGSIRRILYHRGGGVQTGPSDPIGEDTEAARMRGSYTIEEISFA